MARSPKNTGRKQDGTYNTGQSGNPSGRPRGSRNKTTMAVQSLLDGEAEEIGRKAVELAKSGDMAAIRLVLERILPPRKDRPIELEIPHMESIADVVTAQGAIVQAVGCGDITPSEGQAICAMLEQYRRTIETAELEKRITQLEEQNNT